MYFVLVFFSVLVPVEEPKYWVNINQVNRSILFRFLFPFLIYLSLTLPNARIQFTVLKYGTTCITTLTSPTDINAPTRDALVLVTKDSFVSLVTNLNKKNNVCKQ